MALGMPRVQLAAQRLRDRMVTPDLHVQGRSLDKRKQSLRPSHPDVVEEGRGPMGAGMGRGRTGDVHPTTNTSRAALKATRVGPKRSILPPSGHPHGHSHGHSHGGQGDVMAVLSGLAGSLQHEVRLEQIETRLALLSGGAHRDRPTTASPHVHFAADQNQRGARADTNQSSTRHASPEHVHPAKPKTAAARGRHHRRSNRSPEVAAALPASASDGGSDSDSIHSQASHASHQSYFSIDDQPASRPQSPTSLEADHAEDKDQASFLQASDDASEAQKPSNPWARRRRRTQSGEARPPPPTMGQKEHVQRDRDGERRQGDNQGHGEHKRHGAGSEQRERPEDGRVQEGRDGVKAAQPEGSKGHSRSRGHGRRPAHASTKQHGHSDEAESSDERLPHPTDRNFVGAYVRDRARRRQQKGRAAELRDRRRRRVMGSQRNSISGSDQESGEDSSTDGTGGWQLVDTYVDEGGQWVEGPNSRTVHPKDVYPPGVLDVVTTFPVTPAAFRASMDKVLRAADLQASQQQHAGRSTPDPNQLTPGELAMLRQFIRQLSSGPPAASAGPSTSETGPLAAQDGTRGSKEDKVASAAEAKRSKDGSVATMSAETQTEIGMVAMVMAASQTTMTGADIARLEAECKTAVAGIAEAERQQHAVQQELAESRRLQERVDELVASEAEAVARRSSTQRDLEQAGAEIKALRAELQQLQQLHNAAPTTAQMDQLQREHDVLKRSLEQERAQTAELREHEDAMRTELRGLRTDRRNQESKIELLKVGVISPCCAGVGRCSEVGLKVRTLPRRKTDSGGASWLSPERLGRVYGCLVEQPSEVASMCVDVAARLPTTDWRRS